MLYLFKDSLEDFIVEEKLEQEPDGNGDFFYVFFEKKDLNTMDVVQFLLRSFGLERNDLGIAGLKDKVAITRQWISISRSKLDQIGGEDRFLSMLSEQVRVLKTSWFSQGLRVGKHVGNYFEIRLRAKKGISPEVKNQISFNIQKILEKGFPNCFGSQRFGKGNRNYWDAKKVFELGGDQKMDYQLKFRLQSYASMWFNVYVMRRYQKGLFLLQGDIMVDKYHGFGVKVGVYEQQKIRLFDYKKCKSECSDSDVFGPDLFLEDIPYEEKKWIPTGPMLGENLLFPLSGSKSFFRDESLYAESVFNGNPLKVSKLYHLYGFRRPLRVFLDDLEWSFDQDDLCLNFSLPTGSYATVLLAFILEGIDQETLRENRLEVPLVE